MNNKINIALYMRVSIENKHLKEFESESISNQRNLLINYINNSNEFKDYTVIEIIDDGITGRNFERSGFKKLISYAENGVINCIIVKDLSRLGRDFIEVGNYLEQIFPYKGIRFISVNDNYDSSKLNGDIGNLNIIFKNYIHEFYSRDLSKKVKSSLNIRYKKGEFLSPYAPYGYKKSIIDKHKLEIDEESANVVREIFSYALNGYSLSEIARILNSKNILTPSRYKKYNGCKRNWGNSDKINYWTLDSIKMILKNECYIGKVINNKTVKVDVGRKEKKINSKDDWIILNNMHSPIISEENFIEIQEKFKKRNSKKNNSVNLKNINNPFKGIILCGNCKKNIVFCYGKNTRVYCKTKYIVSNINCFNKSILLSEIQNTVLFSILKLLKLYNNKNIISYNYKIKLNYLNKKLKNYKIIYEKNKIIKLKLFENYCNNKIMKDEYILKNKTLSDKIENIKKSIDLLTSNINSFKINYNLIEQIKIIDENFIENFIENIYLYNNNKIEIKLKFNFI